MKGEELVRIGLLTILLVSAWSVAGFMQSPAPLFELPRPTGPAPVGTTRWVVVDASREETFAPGRKREVEVVAWYPAAVSTGTTAPYMRDGMEEVLSFARAAKLGNAYDGLSVVRTHAIVDAPVAKTPNQFPTIVFSHGYTGLPSSHTALMEDLASHGWAVLHVIHPYEATGAMLSDGTVVTYTDAKDAFRPGVNDVFNQWGAEGGTMEKVVAAKDDGEKERLLRGYLTTLTHTNAVVRRWVADVKAALDTRPSSATARMLFARLDTRRIGVAGHSMGGVMAGQFCVEDRRCAAALNLDGIPQYGTMIDSKFPAAFLMVYSARPGRAGASDIIYRRAASKYYRVDVDGTLHLDFSDMNFWGGPIAKRAFGPLGAARAADITRQTVREFFAQELLGRESTLLSGKTRIEGVTVQALRP